MSTPETSVILLQIVVLLAHWTAFVVLFAANAGLYRLVASDEADQHKMSQGLALNNVAIWCWIVLAASGAGFFYLIHYPVAAGQSQFPVSAQLMLKVILAVVAFLLSLLPWRFMRRHAMVRSYRWVNVPRHVLWCLRIELAVILLIMAVAVMIRVGDGIPVR